MTEFSRATAAADGRRYGQLCPLAYALDLLGERWTLLVVRELLLGPKRFGELGARLAGAGPNRLSARLRRLRDAGVAERTSDGAHALTAYGEGLRAPVLGLGSWGLSLLPAVETGAARADLVALMMSGVIAPAQVAGIDLTIEVHAEDVFTIAVGGGEMAVRSGPCDSPAAVRLDCAPATFVDLLLGNADLDGTARSGQISVEPMTPGLEGLFAAFAATARSHLPTRQP